MGSLVRDCIFLPTPCQDHLLLALQPQRRGAIAVVEAVVGGKVLHIRLPGGGDCGGVQVHIVLLLRHIALNVEDELLPCLQFLGAPLLLEHGRELGVIDVTGGTRLLTLVSDGSLVGGSRAFVALVSVTVAPGMAPPLVSCTDPVTDPAPICAQAGTPMRSTP